MSIGRRRLLILIALLAIAAGTVAYFTWFRAAGDVRQDAFEMAADDLQPPDPRLTFATPFRNVHPDIHYVGDAACANCHLEIDQKYHAHPMGRSAELVARASPIERYDASAQNPCPVGDFELRIE